MQKVIKKSFAKINLGLEVLFRRNDLFHEINSVFVPIDLFDFITFTLSKTSKFKLFTTNMKLPTRENIIYQTIKLIKNKYKINISNLVVKLDKKIPIGAGLGGGSSNSAMTIQALNELYNLNLKDNEQLSLASEIGSDVPFFIQNKLSIVRGRGEKITPMDFYLPYKFLIIFPNVHISTSMAYSLLKINRTFAPTKYEEILPEVIDNPSLFPQYFHNDFEEVIFSKYPSLLKIKKKLLDAGAIFSSLSGSGSSIYGIFPLNADLPDLSIELPYIKQFICKQVE
ncbi:MAG: 4-(cytidine 5'-diphospho)-2-C-methyl-D-erythritol kinase [Candidatus Kapaibacteriales bacterium]